MIRTSIWRFQDYLGEETNFQYEMIIIKFKVHINNPKWRDAGKKVKKEKWHAGIENFFFHYKK